MFTWESKLCTSGRRLLFWSISRSEVSLGRLFGEISGVCSPGAAAGLPAGRKLVHADTPLSLLWTVGLIELTLLSSALLICEFRRPPEVALGTLASDWPTGFGTCHHCGWRCCSCFWLKVKCLAGFVSTWRRMRSVNSAPLVAPSGFTCV